MERDFEFTSYGTVWNIRAVSDAAKDFAEVSFPVDQGWQGFPTNFMTDHGTARILLEQLAQEGWNCRYQRRED
jgi:hypothetical protein